MKLLLNQEGQASGAGSVFTKDQTGSAQTGAEEQSQTGGEGQQGGEGSQQTQQQTQQEPQAAPPTSITPEAFAEALKKAGFTPPAAQPQQQQPPKQYTQEDFDKLFNVWKPTPDLIKAIREGDEQAALVALANMGSGVQKQAVTIASLLVQDVRDQLIEQFTPYMNYVKQDHETKLWTEFISMEENKDLKGFEPLLKVVVAHMKDEFKGKTLSKEEGFKALADRARAMIKSLPGAQSQAQGAAGQQTQTTQQGKKMPPLSSGGQAGSGGANAASGTSKKSPAHAVFG